MNRGVLFMNFGMKHTAHLCVAFHAARQHWSGPIAILHDASNRDAMQKFVEHDPARLTELVEFTPFAKSEYGHGCGYLNKTRMIDLSPFVHFVFLDCDTLAVGSFEEMFPADVEVRLTRFCDWNTNGSKMSKRIGRWFDAMPGEVALQRQYSYPAINTGVMGLSKLAKRLSKDWQETTKKNVSFICDEIAMQLIFLRYPHAVFPDYFNCSPVYSVHRERFDIERVRIWHFHGMKSIRHANGLTLWLPPALHLWRENLYGIRESFSHNKYMARLALNPIEHIVKYAKNGSAEKIISSNQIHEGSFNASI